MHASMFDAGMQRSSVIPSCKIANQGRHDDGTRRGSPTRCCGGRMLGKNWYGIGADAVQTL